MASGNNPSEAPKTLDELTPQDVLSIVNRIDEARANKARIKAESVSPEHKSLSPDIQEIVRDSTIRMAGHDSSGNFLDSEQLLADLRLVVQIEEDLVIDPQEIKDQLHQLESLRADERNTSDVQQKIAKFAALGGHATLNSVEVLLDVLRKEGYVFILEYSIDGKKVLGAYMYGFAETFLFDQRFPTLGIESLTILKKEKMTELREKNTKIITNWRTGVPLSFKDLAKKGVDVPEQLLTASDPLLQSPRRWGGGTAVKLALVAMGESLEKEILMLNVGTIQSVREALAIALSNIASEVYNGGFLERSAFPRRMDDPIWLETGDTREHVADILWNVFFNTIQKAMARLVSEHGALRSKGGWDLPRLCSYGHTIAQIDRKALSTIAFILKRKLQSDRNTEGIISPLPEEGREDDSNNDVQI